MEQGAAKCGKNGTYIACESGVIGSVLTKRQTKKRFFIPDGDDWIKETGQRYLLFLVNQRSDQQYK